MTDYGHDIEFGTFITPVNRPPRQAVELAQLAERLGFEFATFQDHPYQPAFHDTWTLMSFVAASTSRIRVAGNVHNLPLRQPAVLARSVASLDLLTDGRVELGLGAGGFWDAIEAMGGRRLAPADAVAALSQAIDVIRGVWGCGRPGPPRGGRCPPQRRRRQAGSAPRPRRTHLDRGLQAADAVDDAARGSGRESRDIRRLLNVGALPGDAGQQAGMLTALARGHGVSTFIIAGDDPAALEAFAAEVAPRVREAVAAERAR